MTVLKTNALGPSMGTLAMAIGLIGLLALASAALLYSDVGSPTMLGTYTSDCSVTSGIPAQEYQLVCSDRL